MNWITRIAALLVFMLLIGCAGQSALDTDLVWPIPPDKPRIQLVDIYSDNSSVGQSKFNNFISSVTGEGRTRLIKPFGVSVDSNGRVYVTDTGVGHVLVFDSAKKEIQTIGKRRRGKLNLPLGIVVVGDTVFVTDGYQKKVFGYNIFTGKLILAIGKSQEFGNPSNLAYSSKNNSLYISDSKNHVIRVYDATTGKFKFEFGEPGDQEGQFNRPSGIAIQGDKVYIIDQMNFRVQIFSLTGDFYKMFGEPGSGAGYLFRPKGIGVTKEGFIFVTDAEFHNFQIFDEDGNVYLFIGQLGNEPGEFSLPAGLCIDLNNNIYVVDQLNSRVQKFKFLNAD
ncbi:MAG: 6-bladed beta-propeller [Planctomycetia bacterium]|nr:6-bladed beta-propeller [Planctomycetia bacterium]